MTPPLAEPPRPAIPRVGDRVLWHHKDIVHTGVYLGHRYEREKPFDRCRPIVKSELLGQEVPLFSFDVLRLVDPAASLGPNWTRLPAPGRLSEPSAEQASQLRGLLGRVTPPGPTYSQFLSEIWHRGYEAYVVGGTVRDVLAGKEAHDVDIATTMPLPNLVSLAVAMYDVRPSTHLLNGYLRIGGSNRSGDPVIDVRVFSKSGTGTPNALFGTEFDADVAQRDFACNSVYYEPTNNVLVDPTGQGVSDATESVLRLVCRTVLKSGCERAEIAIRFFKFLGRGFSCSTECLQRIREDFITGFPAMTHLELIRYVRRQVVAKVPIPDRAAVLEVFEQNMEQQGCGSAFALYIKPHLGKILNEAN